MIFSLIDSWKVTVDWLGNFRHAVPGNAPGIVYGIPGIETMATKAMVMQVRDNLKPQLRWGLAKKILLIDREIWSRDAMAADLSFEGCEVTTVGSALEAIQTLSEETFDLVVVELSFPETPSHVAGTAWDDFFVLEWLRKPGAPAFIATSSEGDKFRSQCLENGAREFLQKPVAPEMLLQAVEQAGVSVGSVSIK